MDRFALVVTLEFHTVNTVVNKNLLDLAFVMLARDKAETEDLLRIAELEAHPA
jgi:hypothetical protein